MKIDEVADAVPVTAGLPGIAYPGTSEAGFRFLVDSAPDAVLLYDSGRDRFVYANPAVEKLFGCAQAEILEHRLTYFFASKQPDGLPIAESYGVQVRRALAGHRDICERRIHNAADEDRLCEVSLVRLPAGNGGMLRASFVDITERRNNEAKVGRLNRALRTLSRGNIVVVRSTSETELLEEMCRAIVEDGGYLTACIGIVQHDAAKTVKIVAQKGDRGRRYIEQLSLSWDDVPIGRGMAGRAIRSGEPQICQHFDTDATMAPWIESGADSGIGSAAAFPLKDSTGVFAILLIYASEPNAFDSDELKLLRELAGDLAYGIDTLRQRKHSAVLEERWRLSLETTVQAIANTVETRDPYTAGHQQRAAKLAGEIARLLGISEYEIQGIHLAGIIHDVGKVNIPAEILNKPGKLSRIETALIREHAEAGYNILKSVDFPWPIAQMVLQHHERLDGSGYPTGLRSEQILPGAKILAVADTVDAIMSHRPYRPALGIDVALSEIEKNRGRLYDEAVVDACVSLFRERGFSFDGGDKPANL